ncbi:MAG: glycosyltransferase family 2 protein, partial [Magnetococcales bacterium]|nr:glycosyltransferase family 2 protein [Magnetococcales bacterium]
RFALWCFDPAVKIGLNSYSKFMIDFLLTIYMPTYNRAEMLRYTLNQLSFLNNWTIKVELLIGDNGSTDHTWDVICEMKALLPMIRAIRYPKNIGASRCMISLLRAALGRYAVYLADDDQLIPEKITEIIYFMEENRDIVAYYTTCQVYNAHRSTPMTVGGILSTEKKRFRKMDSIDLFKIMLTSGAVLDIVVLSTEHVSHFCYNNHEFYFIYFLAFRMLDYGDIYFDPDPFYRWVRVHPPELVPNGQESDNNVTKKIDWYSNGLEYALMMVIRSFGYHTVPEWLLHEAMSLINHHITRARILSSGYYSKHTNRDYVSAVELLKLSCLWQDPAKIHILDSSFSAWEQQYVRLAWLQGIVEQVRDIPDGRLVLCCLEMDDPATIKQEIFASWPDVPIIITTTAEDIVALTKTESALVLTGNKDLRVRLSQSGFPIGHIILIQEWIENFKLRSAS